MTCNALTYVQPNDLSEESDEKLKPESVKSELMMIEFNYKTKSEAMKAANMRRKRRQEYGEQSNIQNSMPKKKKKIGFK